MIDVGARRVGKVRHTTATIPKLNAKAMHHGHNFRAARMQVDGVDKGVVAACSNISSTLQRCRRPKLLATFLAFSYPR